MTTLPDGLKEKDIQRAILEYLKLRGYYCFRNNSGALPSFSEKGKKYFIRLGEAGNPDIIGCTKEGKFFGIEVKSKIGKQSDLQKACETMIKKCLGIYFLASSLDDVINAGF